MLRGDDFSPAAGAGAEENERSECEEKAVHVECWIMDVGFWVGEWGSGCWIMNFGFWILD